MSQADRTDLLPSEVARFEEVCRLGHDNLEPIAATLASAFADDPIWRWLLTGGHAPMSSEQSMAFSRYVVRNMVAPREIHGFRHHRAVALWHAPAHDLDESVAAAVQHASNADFANTVAPLMHDATVIGDLVAAIHAHRPTEPHWYLGSLGTQPDHQGHGLGAQLLHTMQRRCDRLGMPTYLESSNPANYAFYERNGYVETVDFTAAGSPPLRGFKRDPR